MIGQFVCFRIVGIDTLGPGLHPFPLSPACSAIHSSILPRLYWPVAVDGVIVAGLPVCFNSRSRSSTVTPLVIQSSAGAPFR